MGEWSKPADCKPALYGVPWFESKCVHQNVSMAEWSIAGVCKTLLKGA